MSTLSKAGEFDCLDQLGRTEPFFMLRAQDKFAPLVIREWARLAEEAGCTPAKVAEAREIAATMELWPGRKVPD